MYCASCGAELAPNQQTCPSCGAPVSNRTDSQNNDYQQTPSNQNIYNTYNSQPAPAPMSVGGWMGRSLIPLIPVVGWIIYIIMLFVWSGDRSRELSFRNWAKARLILLAIGVFISVLAMIIMIIEGVNLASLPDTVIY